MGQPRPGAPSGAPGHSSSSWPASCPHPGQRSSAATSGPNQARARMTSIRATARSPSSRSRTSRSVSSISLAAFLQINPTPAPGRRPPAARRPARGGLGRPEHPHQPREPGQCKRSTRLLSGLRRPTWCSGNSTGGVALRSVRIMISRTSRVHLATILVHLAIGTRRRNSRAIVPGHAPAIAAISAIEHSSSSMWVRASTASVNRDRNIGKPQQLAYARFAVAWILREGRILRAAGALGTSETLGARQRGRRGSMSLDGPGSPGGPASSAPGRRTNRGPVRRGVWRPGRDRTWPG